MSHPPHDDLPPDAEIPKERWPGQFERYREEPELGDYEAMLGDDPFNFDNVDDLLRVSAIKTPPPWEREGPCGKDHGSHQAGTWKGREPERPFPAKEGAAKKGKRAPGKKSCAGDPASSPLPPWGRGAGGEGVGDQDAAHGEKSCADASSPRSSPKKAAKAEKKPRRKGRCTKDEKNRRVENVAHMLHIGWTATQIYHACKELYGLGKRSAQLYLADVKKELADVASKEDYLAHLQLSKNQHDDLYALARRNLDKIDDPTKVASLVRAANSVLKDRDKVMEDIRHHRAVTRRDESPDSRKNRLRRDEIVEFTWNDLAERMENLRNMWWWFWNQARMCGGETHFNDILSQKVDPELGYYDPIRAKNWKWFAEKKAEEEAAKAAEREKGEAGEREKEWQYFGAGDGV